MFLNAMHVCAHKYGFKNMVLSIGTGVYIREIAKELGKCGAIATSPGEGSDIQKCACLVTDHFALISHSVYLKDGSVL